MKKFVFTMQSLLGVKIAVEKQVRAELAEARRRAERFRRELLEKQEAFARQRAEAERKARRGISVRELRLQNIGFDALFESLARQSRKAEVAEEEAGRVRRRLIDTMRERKMLEKLKEKQWNAYREEVRREEALLIDDFLSNQLNEGGGATRG
ncbi:MAG: flagellar export protein FliJ [Oscillospiraceae bacterium]|jgi:flagellar FliJ protein|nr:flagellar export protein FliJ [Oscillospiraceae bacterium]